MKRRSITIDLSIPVEANPRFADLSRKESENGRTIGGDAGDIKFRGYTIKDGQTFLVDPELSRSNFDGWNQDDINNAAVDILQESYNAIGTDCVEHN